MISKKTNRHLKALKFVRSTNWVLISILLAMGIFGKRGWFDLRRMRQENQRIQWELKKVQEQKEFLVSDIRDLEQNKQAQEHTIRKVLGYIRPDETVIEF